MRQWRLKVLVILGGGGLQLSETVASQSFGDIGRWGSVGTGVSSWVSSLWRGGSLAQ